MAIRPIYEVMIIMADPTALMRTMERLSAHLVTLKVPHKCGFANTGREPATWIVPPEAGDWEVLVTGMLSFSVGYDEIAIEGGSACPPHLTGLLDDVNRFAGEAVRHVGFREVGFNSVPNNIAAQFVESTESGTAPEVPLGLQPRHRDGCRTEAERTAYVAGLEDAAQKVRYYLKRQDLDPEDSSADVIEATCKNLSDKLERAADAARDAPLRLSPAPLRDGACAAVRLTPAGVNRVLHGAAGMTFLVDSFTDGVRGRVAHVRDYRYPNEGGKPYCIWSLSAGDYELIAPVPHSGQRA